MSRGLMNWFLLNTDILRWAITVNDIGLKSQDIYLEGRKLKVENDKLGDCAKASI